MKTIVVVALAALLVVSVAGVGAYAWNGGCWGYGSGQGWMHNGSFWSDYGTPPAGSNPGAYSRGYRAGYGYGRGMHGMWGRGRGGGRGMGYGRGWGW